MRIPPEYAAKLTNAILDRMALPATDMERSDLVAGVTADCKEASGKDKAIDSIDKVADRFRLFRDGGGNAHH